MTQVFDDDLDDDDDDDLQVGKSPEELLKDLRLTAKNQKKQIRELTSKAEKNEESTKKLAFIEAKLPENPTTKFFLDNYKGEYTGEAIRAAAAEHGFIPADPGVTTEVNDVQSMMQASSGGTPAPAPGTDTAMEAEINAVKSIGPQASAEIAAIMARYGRLVPDE